MRVVVLTPGLGVGGAERSLIKLVHLIVPMVDRIDVVCMATADSRMASELPAEARLHVLNGRSSASPWLWLRTIRLMKNLRPDLLLGWSTYANLLAVLVSLVAPVARLVLSERNYVPRVYGHGRVSGLRRWLVLTLMRRFYRRADLVTANSRDNALFLRRYIGGKPEYRLLPNTVDLAVLDARANAEVPMPEGRRGPRILALGRLDYQKGFDILLRAFAQVRQSRPDWRLVIVGEGSERAQLLALCRDLALQDAVHWVGEVTNPYPYYKWADLVVVPSRYEGFPNVPLEAMSLGRAVICADFRTGARELTGNGQYGWLVPVGDPQALARKILQVGASAETMRAMGVSARAFIKENYDVATMRARYAEVLGLRCTP